MIIVIIVVVVLSGSGKQILTFESSDDSIKSEEYKDFKPKQKKGFLPPAMDKGTQVGKLYAKTILSAYYSEKITPREASQCLLGLKIQHFSTIERWCF